MSNVQRPITLVDPRSDDLIFLKPHLTSINLTSINLTSPYIT